MENRIKYRARLRVRMAKALTSDDVSIVATVAGHEVEIKSQEKDKPLRESKWIILTSGGFESEEDAQGFGDNLRAIIGIVGISARIGIDVGEDNATSWINEEWARSIGLIQPGERVHPNVHGLIVFPDDGLSRFPFSNATATVTVDPASLIGSLAELGDAGTFAMGAAASGVRLLNFALMTSEPLAQTVLALSAVEALGQDENWSVSQKAMLERFAIAAESEEDAGSDHQEVADALRRSVHRIGLRQGVLRVLGRLGLDNLKKEWDRLYGLRSGVFHGTARLSDSEMNELGQGAITLCGKIILTLLRHEGVPVPSVSAKHY